jgi:hypothetical protein
MRQRFSLLLLLASAGITLAGCSGGSPIDPQNELVQLALDGTAPAPRTDGRRGHGERRIPEGVLTACNGKAAGDTCSFTHHDRTLEGVCRVRPDDATVLLCRPNPPAELVAACADHAAGDACSFTTPDGQSRTGVCHAPRFDSTPLLCAPDDGGCHHGPGGGPMGPPPGGDGGLPPPPSHHR